MGDNKECIPIVMDTDDENALPCSNVTELYDLYAEQYDDSWEYYFLIKDFLEYVGKLVVEEDVSARVSDFLIVVSRLLRTRIRDVHEFLKLDLFLLFAMSKSSTIKRRLAPLNLTVRIEDGEVNLVAKKRPISPEPRDEPASKIKIQENPSSGEPAREQTSGEASTPSQVNSNTVTNKRSFQLYFNCTPDWHVKLTYVKTQFPSISATQRNNIIKLEIKSVEEFRAVQNYLELNNIPLRTVDPTEKKPEKYLIRGLPTNMSPSDIEDALREVGIEPIKAAALTNRRTKQKLPLYMVVVRPSPNSAKIKTISHICHLAITWENFRSQGAAQCYNCQQFGHSSLTCRLKPACVKCGGEHRAFSCNLPKGGKVKCANCQGPHTANYRGCPNHPDNRAKAQRKTAVRPPRQTFIPAPVPKTNAWAVPLNIVSTPAVDRPATTASAAPAAAVTSCGEPPVTPPVQELAPPTDDVIASETPQTPSTAESTSARVNVAVPKRNRRVKRKTPKRKAIKTSPDTATNIFSIFREMKSFASDENFSGAFQFITKILAAYRRADEPIQKMMNIFCIIDEFINPPA